jgi:predicted alpha/beta hydrolase family esterase
VLKSSDKGLFVCYDKRMARVIIVHGFKGKPDTNWKPWLKNELEKVGISAEIPEMPNTDNPNADEWVRKLSDTIGQPDQQTYLVGHSLGCITILRYLEELDKGQKIGGCVFVAGFTGRFHGYAGGHDSFFDHDLDWKAIKDHCYQLVAIHSENDGSVASEQLKLFKEKLDAETILVNGMGHFGSADNVYEVPLVLSELHKLIYNTGA